MFSSTALPTSVNFAESADFSQSFIGLIDPVGGRTILLFNESGSVQFSAYDPAGALAAIQANLAGSQMNAGVKVSLQNKLSKAGDYINGTSSNSNAKAEQELRAFISYPTDFRGDETDKPTARLFLTPWRRGVCQ